MNLKVHEKILRDAFENGNLLSPQALDQVIRANKFSDLHQFSPERHFDNASNREVLCHRWNHGMNLYMEKAIDLSTPISDRSFVLKDRRKALCAFGAATHALADFYAHTNWVELSAVCGDDETLAPLFGNICSVNDFPVGLQSGYFNLRYGICGCPKAGPPPDYEYCHEQLAKDHSDKGHGSDSISTFGLTYHELAVKLATKATFQLWEVLHQRIIERYHTSDDAEAVFLELAWGKDRPKLSH